MLYCEISIYLYMKTRIFESSFSVISQLQTEIQGGVDIWIIHKFSGNLFLILKKLFLILKKLM